MKGFIVALSIVALFVSIPNADASPHQYRRKSFSSGSGGGLITYRAPRNSGSSARASLRPASTNPQDYLVKDSTAARAFMKQTGYDDGRAGYAIVYVVSLRDGGLDAPSNMRWRKVQAKAEPDKKDAAANGKPSRSF